MLIAIVVSSRHRAQDLWDLVIVRKKLSDSSKYLDTGAQGIAACSLYSAAQRSVHIIILQSPTKLHSDNCWLTLGICQHGADRHTPKKLI